MKTVKEILKSLVPQRKAKRILTDIDFASETSHIALVASAQGGPANGQDYALVMKANNFKQENIEKMQQIQVTLELPEFLERFMGVYGTNAEVLARMMGYVKPEEEPIEENYDDWYENRIQERLDSYTIIKSLHESADLSKSLAELPEDEFVKLKQDQASLEKALLAIESTKVAKSAEDDTSPDIEVTKNEVSTSTEKGNVNMDETLKASLESITKARDEMQVELQKALDEVNKMKAEKLEVINKSKAAKIEALVKAAEVQAPLVKAALSLEGADFDAFVKSIETLTKAVETSDLFVEKGATTDEEEATKESRVAKILKAQFATK